MSVKGVEKCVGVWGGEGWGGGGEVKGDAGCVRECVGECMR